VNRRRGRVRKWRLRGRRAQVSAIATILGLLLVVTFIANYLTATLPNAMSVNDLNHVVLIENQVGRLQALLQAASQDNAVLAQLTQPVTLGGQGIPPFASADPAMIGPERNGSQFWLNYTLQGPLGAMAPTSIEASSGFNVHVVNTYLPQADVALDEGGVVIAQPGGVPTMLDPPEISAVQLTNGSYASFSVWLPIFVGNISYESGVSTTEITTRLLNLDTLSLSPSSTLSVKDHSSITLTIRSPFAGAWAGFFGSIADFASQYTCTGPSAVCNGPYSSGGPLANVVLTIPTGVVLNTLYIQIATFAITVQ